MAEKIIGFPIPYLGIITKNGSFSALLSPILNHSSAIAKSMLPLPPGGAQTYGKIFPYQNHDEIIFLYCDAKKKSIRFNVDIGSHRKIPNSVSPNIHANWPYGVQINNYFWIFGGTDDVKDIKNQIENCGIRLTKREETLIWSIKKERWFRGTLLFLQFICPSYDLCHKICLLANISYEMKS